MKYISAWDFSEQKVASPNNKYLAEVRDVHEFQMSGPVIGSLKVEGVATLDSASVSVCWSEDSKYLAVPILDASKPEFKVLIINVLSKAQRYASGVYGPLSIKAVSSNKVVAVDQGNNEVTIDIGKIKW
ncbi:hypothetical protein [Paraperlucidibaca sp.]|uniref:hypothetical protein n=1 Tax=Paraperlucidibaca sp. TaxID=2708021 RepID=UPI0030F3F126